MDKDEIEKLDEFIRKREQFNELNNHILDKIFSCDVSKDDRKIYLDKIVKTPEEFMIINMEIVKRQNNGLINQLSVESILSELYIWEEAIKNS